jgi:hypothetical protein
MGENNWWFGKGKFGPVLFDPAIQSSVETTLLYLPNENNVVKYVTAEVRLLLQHESDGHENENLSKKYRSWKKFYSSRLEKINENEPFSFGILKNLSLHRSNLEKLNLPFKGTKYRAARKVRKTHCWACRKFLDNTYDFECIACGWILCMHDFCATCGCQYWKR